MKLESATPWLQRDEVAGAGETPPGSAGVMNTHPPVSPLQRGAPGGAAKRGDTARARAATALRTGKLMGRPFW